MTIFLRWIIGLKQPPDWVAGGDWHVEFQSLPQGAWAVGCVALMLVAAGGIWFLYKKEGRTIGLPMRLLLAGLRLGILSCVVLMLLEMVFVITKKEFSPSRLLVLVDTSESMGLSDPYADEETARLAARRVGLVDAADQPDLAELRKASRLALARRALGDLVEPLSDGRELSIYQFANKLDSLKSPASLDDLHARADTAIGEALNNALAAHRGQAMAGVLLVTDGQSNAGEDPHKIAQLAGKEGVPINCLAIGTEQGPSNARLIDIEASPVVFISDPSELSVLIESRGLKGRTGVVTLDQRQGEGPWNEIGREEIVLGEDAAIQRLSFKFTPDALGQLDFRARISDVGPELTEDDNAAIKSVKVIRQKIRALLVAGHPSPEVQFLRNALLRDQALEFASWLQSAQEGYEHIGQQPIRRLPINQQELDEYDVLVLFDPDMQAMGPLWPDLLTKFVGDAGGGLIYVAGEQFSQQLFGGGSAAPGTSSAGHIDNSWLRILPITSDPGLYSSSADVRISARDTWNLELTAEGAADAIFRFNPDPNRNREILASLPGMYWHFPVTRAKPGATVLARHGDPRMNNAFGRHVLLATQRFGPGRTVFMGFDSTYRWRYLHEEYFDGFWARLLDRLGRSKVLGGRYPFTLATEKSVYRTGDQVKLRAELIQSGDEPSAISELHGEIELAGGEAVPVQLEPAGDQPGVMEAIFAADKAGSYLVRVVPGSGAEPDAALRPATLSFKVEPPRQELDNPVLNRGLLDDIARASGGAVFSLADYRDIPAAFKVKQVARVLEYRDELWNAPLLFGGMLVLLTVEWVLRKRCRMA